MGLLQNEDFKTEAELVAAGGNKNQLLNDTKVYISHTQVQETLDDAIETNKLHIMKEIATPATPAANYVKLYPKSDKNIYKMGSDGIEKKIGGGGGGSGLIWRNDDTPAAGEETSFGQLAYTFSPSDTQKLYTAFKVPNDYAAGTQIKLKIKIYNPTASGNVLIQSVATLIRQGTDDLSSTTNQRTSTNSAQTISNANREYVADLDLSDTSGLINGVFISANDTILIYLQRGSDTNTDNAYFMPMSAEMIMV